MIFWRSGIHVSIQYEQKEYACMCTYAVLYMYVHICMHMYALYMCVHFSHV